MNRPGIYILAALASVLFSPAAQAAEIRVFASVDASRDIYTGEPFTLQIVIDGFDQPGEVDISPLAEYNPRSAGGGNASQTSITVVNGRTTSNVVRRYLMNYALTAGKAGAIRIPSLAVTVEGKTYQTNTVELNIVQPGTTDQLELEVTFSEQRCYVGQPVIMTVKFYIYANIGDYQFDIPALTSDTFYVEDLDTAKQYRINRRNREAVLLQFSKVLIPKRSGDIDLGTPSVSADVAVSRRGGSSADRFFGDFFGGSIQYKRFAVSSVPLKLSVLPLPQQDKPDGFYGLVGRYTISAAAAPTKVSVGDPVTLTIRIGGDYLTPVQWPELERVSALADNFKMPSQKSPPAIEDGFKVFTQTIRPANDKASQIPSIPLAYFDVDGGKYVVAGSEPIMLEVSPTKILTAADVEGRDVSLAGAEVEAIKKGISANYEGRDCLHNVGFSLASAVVSPGYIIGWATPLLVLVASVLARILVHATPEQAARKKRRSAAGNAVRKLRKIEPAQLQNDPELLADVMKEFIGRRFDRVAGSLTADDCRQAIISATADAESAEYFSRIVSECEAARYAPFWRQFDSATIDDVSGLIRTIDKKSKP